MKDLKPKRPLALIVAMGRGGVIGSRRGRFGLPWHLPEDLARFRRLTMGHAIVMGRVTHELIGRALPGRRNLVLTRGDWEPPPGVERARSFAEALEKVKDDPLPFVIGGAQVYAQALPLCTHIFLTEVDREVQGDAYFPRFERDEFREVSREQAKTEGVEFVTLERRL